MVKTENPRDPLHFQVKMPHLWCIAKNPPWHSLEKFPLYLLVSFQQHERTLCEGSSSWAINSRDFPHLSFFCSGCREVEESQERPTTESHESTWEKCNSVVFPDGRFYQPPNSVNTVSQQDIHRKNWWFQAIWLRSGNQRPVCILPANAIKWSHGEWVMVTWSAILCQKFENLDNTRCPSQLTIIEDPRNTSTTSCSLASWFSSKRRP